MQSNVNNIFYFVQVDDQSKMTNFFWSDNLSILNFEYFGDVVVFDTIYRTNRYNIKCAPLEKYIVWLCFLTHKSIASFIWVFQTFLEVLGGKAPKTIFINQDSAMASAVKEVFPNTVHRLCVWHSLLNAKQNISHLYSKLGLKGYFNKLQHNCITISRFEKYMKRNVWDIKSWREFLGRQVI